MSFEPNRCTLAMVDLPRSPESRDNPTGTSCNLHANLHAQTYRKRMSMRLAVSACLTTTKSCTLNSRLKIHIGATTVCGNNLRTRSSWKPDLKPRGSSGCP